MKKHIFISIICTLMICFPGYSYRILNFSDRINVLTNDTEQLIDAQLKEGGYNGLRLAGNQLASLTPSFIEILHKNHIMFLDLSRNNFAAFPVELASIASLQALDLSNNNISRVPEYLNAFQSLMILNLSWNNLAQLPKSITSGNVIKNLDISNNKNLVISENLEKSLKRTKNVVF